MNKSILIIGAGMYAKVAYEIILDIGSYEAVGFVDDNLKFAPNGKKVIGTINDIHRFENQYSDIFVAIGNCEKRLEILEVIENTTSYNIVSLISPKAYISPSAQVMEGCCVEPMAVIHSECVIELGCIISAGAIINHASRCRQGVHVDCNATVLGYLVVPCGMKINCGEVYKEKEKENV